MNYYDELLKKIEEYLNEEDFDKARSLIEDELQQVYVPKDVLLKLQAYKAKIGPKETNYSSINDEELATYLFGNQEQQLLAVDYLNKKNLREYLDICNDYLCGNGFINAKVLLIDSLINQEIGETIRYHNNGLEFEFIPKYVLPLEESDGYLSGKKYLEDYYLKEPSKLKMAYDLLYKELIMLLPINQDESEGIIIAKKIIAYIEKAFA